MNNTNNNNYEEEKYLVFVGNPGTGKSTILNGITNGINFESGVSAGTGLTTKLQLLKINNINYGDTPGLGDVLARKQAAEEIEKLLKSGGDFKLVFICTLEAGRVRSNDIVTIKLILESINLENRMKLQYGIIVNKVPTITKKRIYADVDFRNSIIACLNIEHEPTQFIYFNEKDNEIEDIDNAVPILSKKLYNFLDDLPSMLIKSKNIKPIVIDGYAALREEYEIKLNNLANDKKESETKCKCQLEESYKRLKALENQRRWDLAGRILVGIFTFGLSELLCYLE